MSVVWFRNLQIFRLASPFSLTPEALHQRLAQHAFRACGTLESGTSGWVPPLGRHGSELTHAAGGNIMVCLRVEERLLPPAVVTEAVDEKVHVIEDEQGRKVRKKEREAIKDEVIHTLLPRAFTRSQHTFAYLAPAEGWLLVDSASARRIEELTTLLQQSVDELVLEPLASHHSPSLVMTDWLRRGSFPADLVPGDECELQDPDKEGGVVRCRRQDLQSDEIQAHLRAGKLITRVGIAWEERLSMVIGADLSIRRLRFEDAVIEERGAVDDDPAVIFDADFALMSLEIARFLGRMLALFGGEASAGEAADAAA